MQTMSVVGFIIFNLSLGFLFFYTCFVLSIKILYFILCNKETKKNVFLL